MSSSQPPDKATIAPSVHLALGLVQLFFAGNAVFGKIALASVSPRAVLALRVPGAALVFLLLRVAISQKSGWQRVSRADLGLFLAVALLGVTTNQLLFFEGLARTSATNTAVLSATIPVFAAGFSVLLGRERATRGRLAGLGIALGGALIVTAFGRPARGVLELRLGVGELCLIGNSSVYALYLVLSRPLFQRYRTDTAISWIFVFGAITLLPLGAVAALREIPVAPLAARLSLLYILVAPTVGAYFLNGYALRRAPSSLVAVYIYAQPVVAALLASALLDERISGATLVGGALIGVGIALVTISGRSARGAGTSRGDR